eukprot:11227101-Lingulodinium_polyedra.AAC.1
MLFTPSLAKGPKKMWKRRLHGNGVRPLLMTRMWRGQGQGANFLEVLCMAPVWGPIVADAV